MRFKELVTKAKSLTKAEFIPDLWVKAVLGRSADYFLSETKACSENEILIDSLEDFVGYWNQMTMFDENAIAWYIDMASLVNREGE